MMSIIRKIFRKKKMPKYLKERYPEYKIGKGTYGNPHLYDWGEGAVLQIGAYCSFAGGVKIFLGGEHRVDWITTYPFSGLWDSAKKIEGHPSTKGDIVIGNDVWIGTDAVIMSGVSIGDGAVIGARAVVTKDVPPYAVAVGNPASSVKKRFSEEQIKALLQIKWWDWEESRIEKALPMILNNDIETFLEAVKINKI